MTSGSAVSLRECKKRDTWRLIHSAALRLMTERGFDAVSVDDIVAAAGISRRTFFNYFAGKESVVFDPDPDDPALWNDLMVARPVGEPLWVSLRELLIAYTAATADRMILQRRIRQASPELSGCSRELADRFWDAARSWADARADHAVAARAGDPAAARAGDPAAARADDPAAARADPAAARADHAAARADPASARAAGSAADALRLDLTVNAAQTVLNTACPHWAVETGLPGLHDLLRTGFDLLQSPEWTER